jgi:hypothetical protein
MWLLRLRTVLVDPLTTDSAEVLSVMAGSTGPTEQRHCEPEGDQPAEGDPRNVRKMHPHIIADLGRGTVASA